MDATKKVMMAGSLILVWATLAVLQWNLLEAPVRVPLTNVTGPATGGRQLDGRGGGLQVNLSLLKATEMERDTTYMVPRNIFSMTAVEGTLPVNADVVVPNQEETPATGTLVDQGGGAQSRGRSDIWGFCAWEKGHGTVSLWRYFEKMRKSWCSRSVIALTSVWCLKRSPLRA